MFSRRGFGALVAGAGLATAAGAQQAAFPSRPGRVVIPFAPGAATDILSRLMAQELTDALGQPFVAENRTGANGVIAAEFVVRGPKDGYTLLTGTFSTHGTNPHIYPRFPYDPIADFAPITLIATVPLLLVAHPALGAANAGDLARLARGSPGKIVAASGGLGSSQHLGAVLFERAAGVQLDIVHYARGFAQLLPDLMENRVNVTFGDPLSLLPMMRDGKLKPLAVTARARTEMLPDVPTMVEAGLPDASMDTWYGLFVAAGTDPAIVAKLGETASAAVKRPEVAARIRALGGVPSGLTPTEFAAFVRAENTRWGEVIRAAGIRAE